MAERETVEKVRQEIVRFRELLSIMRVRLEAGEREYARLFTGTASEDNQTLKVKDLQWKLAEQMIDSDDTRPLSAAVLRMRFECHELDRAFEELHDNIMSEEIEE
ncbi:MAG: hypothetical protein ABI690_28420 [Chloroflexota bacterium]